MLVRGGGHLACGSYATCVDVLLFASTLSASRNILLPQGAILSNRPPPQTDHNSIWLNSVFWFNSENFYMVIWITGLSGAGKTTLCRAVLSILKPAMPELVHVDGDAVRELFGSDLSFVEADRVKQIKRIQAMALFLNAEELVVMVAALYASPELLNANREMFSDYFEVYVKAPMDLLSNRNSKGLYDNGTKNVVGVDIPWHEPVRPDLTLGANLGASPEEMAVQLIDAIPRLSSVRNNA
jgi:cytidine diphosphoramidate kinase